MKIVCDACQAKYSISDDKVQGKVFKIRCKKCSNIIVVRGGANAAEAAPAPQQEKDTRVYDYGYDGGGDAAPAGDEAVWHVVINQDQVGPMTAVEVQQRYASGEIDNETYIWREGFADWLPIAQVDTFGALTAGGSTTAATSGGGGADAVAAMFGSPSGDEGGTMRSDPGDLFAAAASSGPRGAVDDDGDLFGKKPAPAAAAAAPSVGRETAAQQAQAAKLRGERNENSVLFSLNNLAQLASDRPAPQASSAPSHGSAPGAATGAAGGEGSGLIDIRSMANAYLGGGNAGAAKPVSAGIGSIDDLPVFGGGGFSEPAVIVPMQSRQSNNKLMYALIGSVAALAVAAVIVVVVLVKGGDKDKKVDQVAMAGSSETAGAPKTADVPAPAKTDAGSAAAPAKADTPAPPPPATDTPKTDTPAPPATDTPAKAAEPPAKAVEAPAKASKTPAPAHKDTKSPAHETVAKSSPPPKKDTPAPAAKADAGGCDEVSCVLNNYEGACCQKFRKGGNKAPSGAAASPSSGGSSGLPDGLDRQMISDGVGKVKAKVMACGDKSSAKGQVKVSVKVDGGGHVTSVTVKNTPDPALGNCVASQMQKATFAKTASGGSFGYPFVF